MAHNNLLKILKRANELAILSKKRNVSSEDILQIEKNYKYSRRKFLNTTAKAGMVMSSLPLLTNIYGCAEKEKVKIAIVGGGIAGLNAAYVLKKNGVEAKVFEATKRPGGRILSKLNFITEGITTEVGAEFIDTNHTEMRQLVKEFNLECIDVTEDSMSEKEKFFIDGKNYSLVEVIDAFKEIIPQIELDKNSLDEDYSNEATINFDNIDLRSYLENIKGKTWFSKMLDYAYQGEFGIESSQQSALNLIDFISTDVSENHFLIFGDSDERFKVIGGNDRIAQEIHSRIENQVEFDRALTSLTQEGNKYRLEFKGGGSYIADFVILTIPFTVLRNINFDIPEMSAEKKECIDTLGYGTNTKLLMGFNNRPWREEGNQGYLFNETIQNGWDHGHMQNGNIGPSGYTVFLGGNAGLEAENNFTQSVNQGYLDKLEQIFSGSKESYTNVSQTTKWNSNPYAKGSYAAYKVGQWTTISGLEIEPVGNIFFAGEHCSDEFQGFMNGAAETGKMAALQILDKIK